MIEEATGRAFLLEMNVRPTQICHLAFGEDSDMIGALARRHGAVPPCRPLPAAPGTIAFYPQEVWRDANSAHLAAAFLDVPWHLPDFIDAYRTPLPAEPADWVQWLQRQWRLLRRPRDRTPAPEPPMLSAKARAASPITL
jgi:hypothetical protein